MLISEVQPSDLTFEYITESPQSSDHMSPYNYSIIINHTPYAMYYLSVTYLFYNCEFCTSFSLHLFPPHLFLSGNHPFALCTMTLFSFSVFCFLDSTYNRSYGICLFFSELFHLA